MASWARKLYVSITVFIKENILFSIVNFLVANNQECSVLVITI